jgi:antitoxin component of RelBE/YafQ-DinJ toxin-antitoxin module
MVSFKSFSAFDRPVPLDVTLSISDAIRLLLARVAAEKAAPFVKVFNAEARAAMAEVERGAGASFDSVADLMADLNAED